MDCIVEARQVGIAEGLADSFGRGRSLESVTLVGALEVVVGEEVVESGLDLGRSLVPGGSALDADTVVEHCAFHRLW